MESPTVTIALCQVETEPWDFAGNLARLRAALREAAEKGADLAIAPECVLTGYPDHLADNRGQWLESALALDGLELEELRVFIAELGLEVVVGFAERNGDRLHNTAVHINRKGEIQAIYRKVHCRNFESDAHSGHFTPGTEFIVSTVALGGETLKLGLMICFDREITESVRCLRALGAEVIACPLATDTADLYRPNLNGKIDNEQVTRTRAAENEVAIVVVNHARRFNGGSFAVGPLGEPLIQLGREAEVQVISMPLLRIREEFHARPLGWMGWGYRRPEVYC